MKEYQFVHYKPDNKTPTQTLTQPWITNNYTNIPQLKLSKSFTEESASTPPSLRSSANNITPVSGFKRTLGELLSKSEQDSPANKEPALLLTQTQTQPHRVSIHSSIHHTSQNPAPELRAQNIVDLTGDDTGDLPKPNFEALTQRQNKASEVHLSTNQMNNSITASSPPKNGITTKITIISPTKFSSRESQEIKGYCQKEANQINESITNPKTIRETPFVDPTYDAAFKYLFSNLELAANFIKSMLELKCSITSIKPINAHLSELQQGNHSNENQASLAVDGLFKIKTDNHQNNKILVFLEMQRKPFPGFLTREQIYSALIATNAVKKGISKNYDKIPQVVGIVIALKNVLPKLAPYDSHISTKVQSKDENLIDIKFSSLTNMHIFELAKFHSHPDRLNINKKSSPILQWLNFLLKCGQVKSIPDDASNIIKLAYDHMKRVNMPQQDLALIEASQIKAYLAEHARNQELIDTARNAEIKGEIKSAIKTIQNLLKVPNINDEVIIQSVSAQLQPEQVTKILLYIRSPENSNNITPTINDIIEAVNLLGDNNIEGDEYENFLSGSTNAELPE